MTKNQPADDAVEQVARELCRVKGIDPDAQDYKGKPQWREYEHEALAALQASQPALLDRAKIEAVLEKMASEGELVLWDTDDDRGLCIEEYAELIENVLRALKEQTK